MSASASLPPEIFESALRGELPKVVKWLRKGGVADAFYSGPTHLGGQRVTKTLLQAAAAHGQLEMVREVLKRGASVDLQDSLGIAALMDAVGHSQHSVLLVLLQHSANPDLQNVASTTALMAAAGLGHKASSALPPLDWPPLQLAAAAAPLVGEGGKKEKEVPCYGGASRTPVAEGGGALWKARRSISPREKSGEKTQCGQCATRSQRP